MFATGLHAEATGKACRSCLRQYTDRATGAAAVRYSPASEPSMPAPDPPSLGPPAGRQPRWPVVTVTVLLGALSVGLLWPQLGRGREPGREPTLRQLDRRVTLLARTPDPVERDRLGSPWAASARALDRVLAPQARVFLSGIVGRDNGYRLGVYYFLRNYLFPRRVEISLDGKAVFHESWFEGVESESPEALRAQGFDVLLRLPTAGSELAIVPLTPGGLRR
jgi:hypothetical protein